MNTELNEQFPIFLGSEIDQADPAKAMFHVLPVPYDCLLWWRYQPWSLIDSQCLLAAGKMGW